MLKKVITATLLVSMATSQCFAQSQAPAAANLDQAQKELLAQEEMLLKQVGEVAPAVQEASKTTPEKHQGNTVEAPITDSPAKASPPSVIQSKTKSTDGVKTESAKVSVKSAESCDANELAQAKARIRKLTSDLDETRNRLMISETEVERLALIVDERNRGSNRMAGSKSTAARASLASSGMRVREPTEIQAKAESDMQIATVITEKAQLRTGPGKDNSPLMTVSQGTRLAIETRSGDWYRVISPTGTRAWVSSDVIDFGDATKPDSAARGKGYSTARDAEDAAFEALSRGAKK